MIKELEKFTLTIFEKKYTHLFQKKEPYKEESYLSPWEKIAQESPFLYLHLQRNYQGLNLGDDHCNTLLSAYAKSNQIGNVLNKIYLLYLLEMLHPKMDKKMFMDFSKQPNIPILTHSIGKKGENREMHYLGTYVNNCTDILLLNLDREEVQLYQFTLEENPFHVEKMMFLGVPMLSIYLPNPISWPATQCIITSKISEETQLFIKKKHIKNNIQVALSFCEHCLKLIRERITKRKQFGSKLSDYQSIRFKYAEMYATYQLLANRLKNHATTPITQITLAKSISLLKNVIEKGIHMFGAFGMLYESEMAFYYRKGSLLIKNLQTIC